MVLPGAHSYYINICIEEVMSKETRVPLITKPIKTRRLLYILFFSELLIGLLVCSHQWGAIGELSEDVDLGIPSS